MKTRSKEQSIAIIVTTLLFVALFMAVWFFNDSLSLKNDIQSEKLKSEKMLSEKLALSKDIENLKSDISSHMGKNKELDKKLSDMIKKLSDKENALASMTSRNNKHESELKKQSSEFNEIENQFRNEIANLTRQLAEKERENEELNNAIAAMISNEADLIERNIVLTSILANNYGMEALKKRDKLTVKAKRTKEISVSFDLPTDKALNLNFNVTTPEGKKISNQTSKYLTYSIVDNPEEIVFTASASPEVIAVPEISTKRVELVYKPEEKLKPGVYKIDIYNGKDYLGSSQIRLN